LFSQGDLCVIDFISLNGKRRIYEKTAVTHYTILSEHSL